MLWGFAFTKHLCLNWKFDRFVVHALGILHTQHLCLGSLTDVTKQHLSLTHIVYVIQFMFSFYFLKLVDQLVLLFTECVHCQTKTNSIELLTVNDPKHAAISGVQVDKVH